MIHRLLPAFLVVVSLPAFAQLEVGGGLLDNCAKIDELIEAEKFAEAKEKAQLCLEGIEQKLSGEVSGYFREEIGDWKRTSLDKNQAMGISNITATYEKGAASASVSLTGSAGGAGGLGSLIGLAQFGGGQSVRVAGIQSTLTPDGTVMVPLENGSLLVFESSDFDTAEEAIEGMGDLIDKFPVAEINAKLK